MLEIGKIYSGFKLIEKSKVEEINSEALIFEHVNTEAKLLKLVNKDDNKVFAISFRTPPEDSTGVAHILEHSVLCGSKKFPLKEPFVELIKGSLNTFLNAMTFPDKTMYPIASRNKQDFFNLMDVYLDAVFYPNIYEQPEIFMQEGWHYEIENKNEDIEYKGVVYNEMKGAFSSPESILSRKIMETLYPDTAYGVESGGNPDHIPELTYDKFIEFHKKYYHPSNSYIYLYGDGDILEELEFIEENYLRNFSKLKINSKIEEQKPFDSMKEIKVEYPILPDEKEEDKTFLSLNLSIEKSTDKELYLAFDILEHLLLETQAAPLKRALIESGIGKDVFGSYENSIFQPFFSIIVKNSNDDKKQEFISIVRDTLNKLVKEGIDKKLVEASINIKEFALREADFGGYPTGLIYGIKCMDSWLYDEEPLMHLRYEKQLNKIKTNALNNNYFENLIEKYLLNNSHSSLLIVSPAKGIAEKKNEKIRKNLRKYKESLTEEELDNLIKETKVLKERQITEDSQENLKKIPLLSIEDIDKDTEKLPIEINEEKGVKILKHNIFTNKIAYVNLYFNICNVPQEYISYVGLLSGVIGKIDTENYSYEELSKEINIYTGGISSSVDIYSNSKKVDDFTPMFKVRSKSMIDKLPKLFELLKEELMYSKFNNHNRIKELISEMKSRMEMVIFDKGHLIAAGRLGAYFSASSDYSEKVSGLELYHFICQLERDFDGNEIENKLKDLCNIIFNKENLTVSVTIEEEDYKEFKSNFHILYNELGNNKMVNCKYEFKEQQLNEGLMTSGKVQYNAKGYNFKKLGYEYSGAMRVLKSIVSYDYLWNKVRVQGGAYGCFGVFNRNGNMFFTSYRDPALKNTLFAYDEISKYIDNFSGDEREITKYIIGTISDIDTPLTPSMKGERAAANYFSNISYEDLQKEREEILNVKKDDIRSLSKVVNDCMSKNYICVLGSEEKIRENKVVFNSTLNVFE
ncbi:insulinase family protein [Clostridium cochlearium]|uniref:Insulinase family protein n=1 Tax=Clostridium cochlearium TaxID=1494 RepID=A0A7Y4DEN8_CLOCO|nr:insulinase family protein [Clostridium cochlearium]NOH17013.1 insulinase family protein [Clostridium cochlearium]